MKMEDVSENKSDVQDTGVSESDKALELLMEQMASAQKDAEHAPVGLLPDANDKKSVYLNTPDSIGVSLKEETDINYWDIDGLPTKNLLYPEGTRISARALKVMDVKKLTSIDDETADIVVNDILRKCVRGIDIYDIYSADKLYILLWLRANSFKDNKYVVDYHCSKCDKSSSYHFDVTNINVDYLTSSYVNNNTVTLDNGDIIKTSLLTIRDEINIKSFHDKYEDVFVEKFEEIDDDLLSISFMIDTINGKTVDNTFDKYEYLLNMDPGDFAVLTGFLSDINVGVKPYMTVKCTECGGDSQIGVTFHPDFFLPSVTTN